MLGKKTLPVWTIWVPIGYLESTLKYAFQMEEIIFLNVINLSFCILMSKCTAMLKSTSVFVKVALCTVDSSFSQLVLLLNVIILTEVSQPLYQKSFCLDFVTFSIQRCKNRVKYEVVFTLCLLNFLLCWFLWPIPLSVDNYSNWKSRT